MLILVEDSVIRRQQRGQFWSLRRQRGTSFGERGKAFCHDGMTRIRSRRKRTGTCHVLSENLTADHILFCSWCRNPDGRTGRTAPAPCPWAAGPDIKLTRDRLIKSLNPSLILVPNPIPHPPLREIIRGPRPIEAERRRRVC